MKLNKKNYLFNFLAVEISLYFFLLILDYRFIPDSNFI